jgi:hypothetical protein
MRRDAAMRPVEAPRAASINNGSTRFSRTGSTSGCTKYTSLSLQVA